MINGMQNYHLIATKKKCDREVKETILSAQPIWAKEEIRESSS